MLYRRIELDESSEGEMVQFLGVYALRWSKAWGEPAVAFVEATEEQADRDRLAAELAEARRSLAAMATYGMMWEQAEAELAALRSLCREAGMYMRAVAMGGAFSRREMRDLAARLEAAGEVGE